MRENIYFDNAATTQVRKEVYDEMLPYFRDMYSNPSSIYQYARSSKKALDKSREQIANAINANSQEIYFTSSGTESINWAIKGVMDTYKAKGNHIITTCIEHHAVLHTCKYLEKQGFNVTYLPVDEFGLINIEDLKNAITKDTILISIMFANNEVGTIQPIEEIGKIAHENKILFHTDAVQAIGHLHVDVNKCNIDLLSLSGHKVYCTKGVGALYIKKGVRITSLIHGGAQERNRRAGTENIPAIVGLGKAIELAVSEIDSETNRLLELRDMIIEGVFNTIPNVKLNGHRSKRLPGNINLSFEFVEGESILLMLDFKGICASSGSACTSGSLDPSHVLLAMGIPHEIAHGSLRISLGRYNTKEEVEYFLKELPPIIERLRSMSPLYEEYLASKK